MKKIIALISLSLLYTAIAHSNAQELQTSITISQEQLEEFIKKQAEIKQTQDTVKKDLESALAQVQEMKNTIPLRP